MKKLTLSLEENDIRAARRIAREHGTSISCMFSRLIRVMARRRRAETEDAELPPLTRKLTGIVALPKGETDREITEEGAVRRQITPGAAAGSSERPTRTRTPSPLRRRRA